MMRIVGYSLLALLVVIIQSVGIAPFDLVAMTAVFIAFMVDFTASIVFAWGVGILEGLLMGSLGLASLEYMSLVGVTGLLSYRMLANRSLPALGILGVVTTILLWMMRYLVISFGALRSGESFISLTSPDVLLGFASVLLLNCLYLLLLYAVCYYPFHKARAFMITG